MASIPKSIQPHIDSAFPGHVCLIGTCLPDGFAQITPRGSTQIYDDDTISLWERGRGSTTANLAAGTKVTVYYSNFDLYQQGLAFARFYGVVAGIHKSGPVYDKVWERLIQPEKDRDPDKGGFAVLIKIERSEDLMGQPLK